MANRRELRRQHKIAVQEACLWVLFRPRKWKGLYAKLRVLELRASRAAVAACNDPDRAADSPRIIRDAVRKARWLLGGTPATRLISGHHDPRGYQIRIPDTWLVEVKNNKDLCPHVRAAADRIATDFGGNVILAPAFDGD